MRGRKPLPAPLKLVRGNPGKRAVKAEPKPTLGQPTRPEWLSPEAKREWSRLVPELERLQLLTLVDRAALAAYCTAWAHLVAAEKYIRNHGPIGPQWKLLNDAIKQVRAFATEFGFTPSSRSRIAAPAVATEDELEELLNEAAR